MSPIVIITDVTANLHTGDDGILELDIWHPTGASTRSVTVGFAEDGATLRRMLIESATGLELAGVRFASLPAGRYTVSVDVESTQGCVASAVGRPRQIHVTQ